MRFDILFFKVRHKLPTLVFLIGAFYILASRRSLLLDPSKQNYGFTRIYDQRQSQRTDRAGFVNDQLARRSKLAEECFNVPFQEHIGMLYFEEYQLKICGSESNVIIKALCPLYYPRCKGYNTKMFQELRFKTQDFFSRDKHFTSALIVSDPFTRIAKAYTHLNQSEGYSGIVLSINTDYRAVPFNLFNTRKDSLLHEGQQALLQSHQTKLAKKELPSDPHNPYLNPLGPTFEEFILYLLTGHLPRDYLPLSVLCAPCSARFDYILKDTDSSSYLSHFTSDSSLPSSSPASLSPDALQLFSSLPDPLLKFFYKIYQRDCEMFDLPCEEIVKAIREHRRTME